MSLTELVDYQACNAMAARHRTLIGCRTDCRCLRKKYSVAVVAFGIAAARAMPLRD